LAASMRKPVSNQPKKAKTWFRFDFRFNGFNHSGV